MPLARLELRNEYGLGDPKLYRRAADGKDGSKEILDGLAVAGLVGILRQLGDVAEFGAEIFHDLHEQVMATSGRGHKVLTRIRKVEELLPSIEDAIHGKGSYIDLAYETGSNWHSDIKVMDSHLSHNNFPQFMMDSYKECRDPPRLYLLDKYDRAGIGACFKRYSDPSYFHRERVASELGKPQPFQKEKKPKKIKRRYSQFRDGEIQGPICTSQCKSMGSFSRFASPDNDVHCFSSDNSSVSEMRLKPEVFGGPRLLKTISRLICAKQVSVECPSVTPNDLEYERLSISNVQNNKDHQDASQRYINEHEFSADDVSNYDFMHEKIAPISPSVIWDEKSELMKAAGPKFCDTYQDLKLLLVSSESSKVEEHTKNGSMEQAKPSPITADSPRSSCEIEQFEEVTEADNFMDALNTLDLEAEIESECQTKWIQSLSSKGYQNNESEVEKMPKKNIYSSIDVPLADHNSSNNYMLPSDTYLDVSRTSELKQSTQEAGVSPGLPYSGMRLTRNNIVTMSRTNAFQEIHDDQLPWSTCSKSENINVASQIHISPQISISNIPSTKFWTNGNLLGLQPSKPPDICVSDGVGGRSEFNSLNAGMELDKENIANGQRPQHFKTISKVEGLPESLSSEDQRILNSNQFLSQKHAVEGHNSMKHSSTYIDRQYDDFWAKQNTQEQSETISFNQSERSHVGSPNVLTTGISQGDKVTSIASSMKKLESNSASIIVSQAMDSLPNSKCLSPIFSELPHRILVQGLQIKPSATHTRSSIRNDPDVNNNQSEGKPLFDIQQQRLNGVASQTIHKQNLVSQTLQEQYLPLHILQEQNLASQTSQEHNLASQTPNAINKTNNVFTAKSTSSSSRSQNSSPPLEHMKLSFHPMNSHETSNLKLAVSDGCISQIIDGNLFPSLLSPGCTLPVQDDGSESDDDTFCRSYAYSAEDLLSSCSDSNSDIWEQDECSVSKINELPDDLRRISSSKTSISCYSGVGQSNYLGQKFNFMNIYSGSDTVPFQPDYVANIPSLESLINHIKCDSLSISPENAASLAPTELQPPPPPLPPTHWRLVRPSYEKSEENYSIVAQLVDHFEGPLNQNLSAPAEDENIIHWQPTLWEDERYKKTEMGSLLQTNLSPNPYEPHRREQLLHQIRDMDIQHKLKACEKSNSHQVATHDGIEERGDLLHQIKSKTLNLRRTTTSTPSTAQPTTNLKVAAILEKANAIRQACASSDEAEGSGEWSDG